MTSGSWTRLDPRHTPDPLSANLCKMCDCPQWRVERNFEVSRKVLLPLSGPLNLSVTATNRYVDASAVRPEATERGMPPKQKTTAQIFTLGYEQRDIKEFVQLLTTEEIDLLLDVRETAWSHKPGFSKSALSEALRKAGIEYEHAHWVGNPKWIRSTASSHEDCLGLYRQYIEAVDGLIDGFVDFVSALLDDGRRICLVCYERHPGDCHRGILAELLEKHGDVTVRHIAPEGRPRMVAIA